MTIFAQSCHPMRNTKVGAYVLPILRIMSVRVRRNSPRLAFYGSRSNGLAVSVVGIVLGKAECRDHRWVRSGASLYVERRKLTKAVSQSN